MKTFIVLLPTIFFSIAFITVIGLIKKANGKDNALEGLLKQTGEGAEKTSASRFVLLLSGLASVIIGISFVTFYLYASLYKDINFDIKNAEAIRDIVLALGIGVIPYAANQLKDLFK